jgi:[acyl-carrier-protein] S-malonyltransferase
MLAEGVARFVEIGPGKTLAGFVRKIEPGVEIINVSDAASLCGAISAWNA